MDLNKPAGKPRVVIVGGGFAGINLAKKLKKQPVEVLLIDQHNYHTFQPLLYQVATGTLESDAIGFPLRRIFTKQKDFNFHMAEVQKIKPESNTIVTNVGTVRYDYLVLATGADTNYFGNKEMEYYTLPMKNVEEALNLRSYMLQNIEKAVVIADEAERNALLTFVVVGGGATGVELAGAIAEMRNYTLCKDYPTLCNEDMKVFVVEGKEKLIASMSEQASAKAKQFLMDMDIFIYNGVHVESYDGEFLKIDDGNVIRTRNVFWAAGVKGQYPQGLPVEVIAKGNRIQTDEINRVKGFQNIFAIGDVAAIITPETPYGHPGVAPAAIQQGQHLAKNIVHLVKGEPTEPFVYHDKGTLATVGRNKAVADLGKLRFQGFFAWLLWIFVHLITLVGFSNKMIVFMSWFINYFNRNSDNRMIVRAYETKTLMGRPEEDEAA
jgi:NADH dehydrogenase